MLCVSERGRNEDESTYNVADGIVCWQHLRPARCMYQHSSRAGRAILLRRGVPASLRVGRGETLGSRCGLACHEAPLFSEFGAIELHCESF
jgi:hypothetical protein